MVAVSTVYAVDPELAARWLDEVDAAAQAVRFTQGQLAERLERLDRALLIASTHWGVTVLGETSELSRPTVYKAIERARTRAENAGSSSDER